MGTGEDRLIYTGHFGLDALPFENVPDPTFFFDQGDYTRVLEHLSGCFRAGRGLMVVAGPIGSGKTTLSQRLLLAVPANTKFWRGWPNLPRAARISFVCSCRSSVANLRRPRDGAFCCGTSGTVSSICTPRAAIV